jgi:DNA-binding NtrC family response regulator
MSQQGAAQSLDFPAEDTDTAFALVVAPGREQRTDLSRLLRRCGFDVATVSDQSEALDRIGDFLLGGRHFELVVVDVRVHQRSGLSVLLGLRHGSWRPPVILVVAAGDRALGKDTEHHGAFAVLEWPFAFELFEHTVLSVRRPLKLRVPSSRF